jgi:hypothetical protein
MGEAKRRAEQGLPPRPRPAATAASKAGSKAGASSAKARAADTSPRIAPWLPLTRFQGEQFVRLTTRGAWIGIAALVLFWVIVRFIGPAAGWWTLADG